MTSLILDLFGPTAFTKDASQLFAEVDFSQTKAEGVNTNEASTYLHRTLIPSFGRLGADYETLDEDLKVATSATLRYLRRIPPAERNWERILSALMQSPVLMLIDDGSNIHTCVTQLRRSNGPDEVIPLSIVETGSYQEQNEAFWSHDLTDDDVLKPLPKNVRDALKIMLFRISLDKLQYPEKSLVDIGIFRFPDLAHPYIGLYRVKVDASYDIQRAPDHGMIELTVRGSCMSRKFEHRPGICAMLQGKNIETALKDISEIAANIVEKRDASQR